MKTVPTVRLADTTDAAALPDLPEEVRLAMTDIAGAAREGLMAMSVAAGLAVLEAMFEAEIAEGHEVPLSSYAHFAGDDMLMRVVMERMLAGVATRRHARTAEPVGTQVDKEAKSTSRSAISRRFVRQSETALAELM